MSTRWKMYKSFHYVHFLLIFVHPFCAASAANITTPVLNGKLSDYIIDYDILTYDTSAHQDKVEAVGRGEHVDAWMLHFGAHGRTFAMVLRRHIDYSVSTYDGEMLVVKGHLLVNKQSIVFGVIDNEGVFVGYFKTPQNEVFWIERAHHYFTKNETDFSLFHSIIYSDKHLVEPKENISHPNTYCATQRYNTHPLIYEKQQNNIYVNQTHNNRMRRSIQNAGLCKMLIVIDLRLWNHYKTHREDTDKTVRSRIFSDLRLHFEKASNVYRTTMFKDGSDIISNFQLRMKKVIFYSPAQCAKHKSSSIWCSTEEISSGEYLKLFAEGRYPEFCAAFLFTAITFSQGTIGIAYMPQERTAGMCSLRENTGLITVMSFNQALPYWKLAMTLAHESGHLAGSFHDDDVVNKARTECYRSNENTLENQYIMYSIAVDGLSQSNRKFSPCSIDAMSPHIAIWYHAGACFEDTDGGFCGNEIVEVDETCDCGDETICTDKCCHSSDESKEIRCTLTPGSNCSVSGKYEDNKCCDPKTCSPKQTSIICLPETDCRQEAKCAGNGQCSKAKSKKDHIMCGNNRMTCEKGECVGSLCSHLEGWTECEDEEFPCILACKKDGGACISTRDVAKSKDLMEKHKDDLAILINLQQKREIEDNEIKNATNPQNLPIVKVPGQQCKHATGFCDFRGACRMMDQRTVLEKMKELLKKSQALYTFGKYMLTKWWGMVTAFVVISVLSMFIALFAMKDSSAKLGGKGFVSGAERRRRLAERRKNMHRPKLHRPRLRRQHKGDAARHNIESPMTLSFTKQKPRVVQIEEYAV